MRGACSPRSCASCIARRAQIISTLFSFSNVDGGGAFEARRRLDEAVLVDAFGSGDAFEEEACYGLGVACFDAVASPAARLSGVVVVHGASDDAVRREVGLVDVDPAHLAAVLVVQRAAREGDSAPAEVAAGDTAE